MLLTFRAPARLLAMPKFLQGLPRTSRFYDVAQLPLSPEGLELELVHLAEISSHPSRAFEHKYYIRAKWEFSNFEDFPNVSQPTCRPLHTYVTRGHTRPIRRTQLTMGR